MKTLLLIALTTLSLTLFSCDAKKEDRFIFFLHNRFLEEHALNEVHPEYGQAEYEEILAAFAENGFTVISEKRKPNTDIQRYAQKTVAQIDSLIQTGVSPNHITVVGTSKGGFIAQYVSTFAKNPNLNYVFIGASFEGGIATFPDLNLSGNILAIHEQSDEGSVSLSAQIKRSKAKINHFQEIELNTGMHHGFLFKALHEWIDPTIKWANEKYDLNE